VNSGRMPAVIRRVVVHHTDWVFDLGRAVTPRRAEVDLVPASGQWPMTIEPTAFVTAVWGDVTDAMIRDSAFWHEVWAVATMGDGRYSSSKGYAELYKRSLIPTGRKAGPGRDDEGEDDR
jgi:hypothetical protein